MLTVAILIAHSALQRKESRGAHYRLDYLETHEECIHSCLTKKDGITNSINCSMPDKV